jgi:hypothetical protein
VSPDSGQNHNPILRIGLLAEGKYFHFLYDDGTEFFLDRRGTEIWADWPPHSTLEDTVPTLLGQALGFVQRLRGVTCLHASAVEVEGKAIALLGPAGAGKSSSAAAFLQLGYRVLADDVVPVLESKGKFLAQPAHPRVWLCPDIVRSLYGSTAALPQMTPSWEKRYIDLNSNGKRFEEAPVPLAALYLLDARKNDAQAPLLQAVSAQAGLVELIGNTYVNLLLNQAMRVREFKLLGRLVAGVPVRRLKPHSDSAKLLRQCEIILDDVHRVASRSLTAGQALPA